MKCVKYLLTLIILFCASAFVFAWGPDGHRITGKVAYQLLDQKTKDSVKFYLQDLSLENACNWMDEIKSNHDFDYMRPWHYINIDRGQKYESLKGGNIVGELNNTIARLKEKNKYTREQIATDLKILAHLVGDLHQPLHCGYGIDTGGNAIQVIFFTWPSNLHRVWDTDILTQMNISAKDCLKDISKFPQTDIDRMEQPDVLAWCMESRSYLDKVYDFKGGKIGDAYAFKNSPVIEKQLAVAGLRLSWLLKEIFES